MKKYPPPEILPKSYRSVEALIKDTLPAKKAKEMLRKIRSLRQTRRKR